MKFPNQLAHYKKLVADMEEKIEELKGYEEEYLKCSQKLINSDATVLNQQMAIENTRKTLERLTKENECLKQLLVSEWS